MTQLLAYIKAQLLIGQPTKEVCQRFALFRQAALYAGSSLAVKPATGAGPQVQTLAAATGVLLGRPLRLDRWGIFMT